METSQWRANRPAPHLELKSELAFTRAEHVIAGGLHEFIDSLQIGLDSAGDALRKTWFER